MLNIMTLHLTRISESYILQVSDRLVSGGIQDPIANKNIIYWARDAIVSIAYTGLAYEFSLSDRNIPTDEWIAGILWGKPIPRLTDENRPPTICYSKIERWLDIGQSMIFLRDQLQNSLEKLPKSYKKLPFLLIAAGWQEKRRGRILPIFIVIEKKNDSSTFVIRRPQRYWYFGKKVGLDASPKGYVTKEEISHLTNQLKTGNQDEIEKLFVDEIRSVAFRNPNQVGSHCMSILLPPQPRFPIRIRFIPEAIHTTTMKNNIEHPIAFSPWIIGSNMFCAPSIHVGNYTVTVKLTPS